MLHATDGLFMVVRSDPSLIKADIDVLADPFLDQEFIKSEAALSAQLRPVSPRFHNAGSYASWLLDRRFIG